MRPLDGLRDAQRQDPVSDETLEWLRQRIPGWDTMPDFLKHLAVYGETPPVDPRLRALYATLDKV